MVPVKCWLVVSRNDCFCPEKSSGQLHLSKSDAEKEKKDLDEKIGDVANHFVEECTIMSKETFLELCPDWSENYDKS